MAALERPVVFWHVSWTELRVGESEVAWTSNHGVVFFLNYHGVMTNIAMEDHDAINR